MTNYEAIITMSIDEMATFLCGSGSDLACKDCCYKNNELGCKVIKGSYRNWLEKEKKNDNQRKDSRNAGLFGWEADTDSVKR